jgi:hypothetical protein
MSWSGWRGGGIGFGEGWGGRVEGEEKENKMEWLTTGSVCSS